MNKIKVDLFSDTGTRPSREMRQAMAEAEVGDEQLLEDPTVNRLNQMVADLLGKEDAIYLPSGVMANQIAFAVHCQPGDEIIMDKTAHPIHYEAGAVAVISGASIRPVDGERGIFQAEQLEAAIRSRAYHEPQSRLVSIEQTSNLGGGAIWPLKTIREVCQTAKKHGLATHMDGARLLNAVVATGISAAEYAEFFDSVWIDLSKGLGAPVGSVLAGSREFIDKAQYWKKRLGGAMRQAGIIAAGGIYALENNIERLKEDHENARYLAENICKYPEIELDLKTVETNIVLFKVKGIRASDIVEGLLERGIRVSLMGQELIRAVTHLDVSREDIGYVIDVLGELLS
ncbi:MAG TPA: aminotransferase class V-fold PLP-dependent enzyme [Halanaerobiaceae bacterium]|nr:GntG family PLP-dependent aldolase [Bacillota bacterium]HHU92282.1 aminotransferase class V-fold PLP-dependent enzyme [Halanaerobiaceae bacterium]HOA41401.1 GntG family PLP-dependent aldolase [Halanaerobiales bacterium]HPZ62907.1 GntG family PLP-dependent aldolase [Halanaerobiales bacterium]HQD04094.1 GntG family PLP-dependent aldolase [Halanaerobiales bacterium]